MNLSKHEISILNLKNNEEKKENPKNITYETLYFYIEELFK